MSFVGTGLPPQGVGGGEVALSSLADGTQGDVMYFNGTNWVSLTVGTSGQFLKTQGASANPVWASSGGAWTKVADSSVSGSAVTEIDLTSLDLEANVITKIFFICLVGGSNSDFQLLFNDDTTLTNYDHQKNRFGSTTSDPARAQHAKFIEGGGTANNIMVAEITLMKVASQQVKWVSHAVFGNASIEDHLVGGSWDTTDNITSIAITATTASAIGIGSRVILMKMS